MQRNASLWADVFLVKSGASPDPNSPKFDPRAVHHMRKREHSRCVHLLRLGADGLLHAVLTRYLPKAKIRKEKKLLRSKAEDEGQEPKEVSTTQFSCPPMKLNEC